MIKVLKEKNPDIEFYSIFDSEFESFGRVIKNIDPAEIIRTAQNVENPESGSSYTASLPEFEALSVAEQIQNELFGSLPAQVGYCWGHNSLMNATEWHTCSEINIAVTDLVLILGHLWDIKDDKIDSSKFKAFFVPKGSVIEVYATSLHFCPCEVNESGFGCVVALSKGTNTDLEITPSDKKLFRKNKWIIAHEENTALINRGVVAGISGKNYKISY